VEPAGGATRRDKLVASMKKQLAIGTPNHDIRIELTRLGLKCLGALT
jgi:hypothetical protein